MYILICIVVAIECPLQQNACVSQLRTSDVAVFELSAVEVHEGSAVVGGNARPEPGFLRLADVEDGGVHEPKHALAKRRSGQGPVVMHVVGVQEVQELELDFTDVGSVHFLHRRVAADIVNESVALLCDLEQESKDGERSVGGGVNEMEADGLLFPVNPVL